MVVLAFLRVVVTRSSVEYRGSTLGAIASRRGRDGARRATGSAAGRTRGEKSAPPARAVRSCVAGKFADLDRVSGRTRTGDHQCWVNPEACFIPACSTAESCFFRLRARNGTYRFMRSFVANEGAEFIDEHLPVSKGSH